MKEHYDEQLRLLYAFREEIRKSDEKYRELVTDVGTIMIPTKAAIKAINRSIEHYNSRINYILESDIKI
jgi:uncharacterized coiled-coil DUF342 family protein